MDKFAFVHIPKTGGSAFWGLVNHHCEVRASPHRLMIHYINGGEMFDGDYDLYGGHALYEILKDILGPETHYVTLLRNPINRVYSHWNHLMAKNVYQKYGFVAEVPFTEFIRDIRAYGITSNFQARYLAYKPIMPAMGPQLSYQIITEQSSLGMNDQEIWDTARKNLGDFALVGCQERFANTVMKMCMLMGFPPPLDVPVKVVDYRDQISDEDYEYLLEMNRIDMDLWKNYTE